MEEVASGDRRAAGASFYRTQEVVEPNVVLKEVTVF